MACGRMKDSGLMSCHNRPCLVYGVQLQQIVINGPRIQRVWKSAVCMYVVLRTLYEFIVSLAYARSSTSTYGTVSPGFYLLPDRASRLFLSRLRRSRSRRNWFRMGSSSSTLKLPRKFPRSSASSCQPSGEAIAEAMALKDMGNEHFRAGKFKEADQLYSQA